MADTATFRVWRGDGRGGQLRGLLDACVRRHGRARCGPSDSGQSGQRSGRAMELQSRQVRIVLGRSQRPSATDVHDAPEPARPCRAGHHRAHASLSGHQGSRHRCIVEFSRKAERQAVLAAASGRAGWNVAHVPGRRRAGAGISEVHRVFSLPGCVPRAARAPDVRSVRRALAIWSTLRRSRCTRSTRRTARKSSRQAHGIGYCNITKCCTKVCPESITITDNAIIPLKERVIDRLYDPVAKLLRMFRT